MSDPSVDFIRQRMARIRARAQNKADRLGEETRQFLDWKHYLRLFPWSILTAAAVTGYLLVPRRTPISRPTANALVELAREQQAQKVAKAAAPTEGLLSSLLGMAGNTVLRAGLAFAAQQASKLALQAFAPAVPDSTYQQQEVPRHDFV